MHIEALKQIDAYIASKGLPMTDHYDQQLSVVTAKLSLGLHTGEGTPEFYKLRSQRRQLEEITGDIHTMEG